MTQLKAASSKVNVAMPIVLFGIGSDDKPQAALFSGRLCDLALKAAQQLKLNVLKVTNDEIAKIAARLPAGRINSTGRSTINLSRLPARLTHPSRVLRPPTTLLKFRSTKRGRMGIPQVTTACPK